MEDATSVPIVIVMVIIGFSLFYMQHTLCSFYNTNSLHLGEWKHRPLARVTVDLFLRCMVDFFEGSMLGALLVFKRNKIRYFFPQTELFEY